MIYLIFCLADFANLKKGEYMKIILAAHGVLATEFHNTLQMIVGDVKHFYPVNFYPDDGPEQLRARIEEVLKLNSGEEYIIFTDLYGGTPFNVSAGLAAEDENVTTVAGMNLPMLLELAFVTEGDRKALVAQALESAKAGVREFVLDVKVEVDDEIDDEF